MFADLNNGLKDQAARAAVALLVSRSIKGNVALVSSEWPAVLDNMLQESGFLATSVRRWTQYQEAVARNMVQEGEKTTNRAWGEYPGAVKAAARELANAVQNEMAIRYEEAMRAM